MDTFCLKVCGELLLYFLRGWAAAGMKVQDEAYLSTGKIFTIQSFPLHLADSYFDFLAESGEDDLRVLLEHANPRRMWNRLEDIVCKNVVSVRFCILPQNMLMEGFVSLKCLSLVEIGELYLKIRDLSFFAAGADASLVLSGT
ncbi:hypothetical protein F4X90_08890 [Candidatus Poribacteria bacterium]|nr:hypothetical protein [Candidatus Poribacteria bacterium]